MMYQGLCFSRVAMAVSSGHRQRSGLQGLADPAGTAIQVWPSHCHVRFLRACLRGFSQHSAKALYRRTSSRTAAGR
jgi:hypothetical protein